MPTPSDTAPPAKGAPYHAPHLSTLVVGVLLATIVCVVMRPAGTLVALVMLYVIGLAVVLRMMVQPPAS